MKHSFKLKNAALVMALAAVYPMQAGAAAGITQFAVGDVNVRRGQALTPLNRGQQINSGDNIVTGARGRTQIRFSDGGLVSLAPNSQFNIDKYQDENKPEEDGFFASFLRGSMRAITGLVGKRSRENYKITTTTATIGIRGSAFYAGYLPDGAIEVAGEQDAIVVCTNAGCVDLIVGEAVTVTDANSLPKRRIARSNALPLVPREVQFESVNPEVIDRQSDQINGVLPGVSAMFAVGQSNRIDSSPRGGLDPSTGQATFVNGLMVRHEVPDAQQGNVETLLNLAALEIMGGSTVIEKTSSDTGLFGTVGFAGDAGFIGWGYWNSGRVGYSSGIQELAQSDNGEDWTEGVHYLVGRPTPYDQMPMTGYAPYTLLGGTAPTAYDGYILRSGTLDSAGLVVDFGSGRLNGFINTTFMVDSVATPVVITGYGYVDGAQFSGYSDNEDGEFYGFFTGAGAARAGMVYQVYAGSLGTVHGSAVLLKGAFERQENVSAMFAPDDGEDLDDTVHGGYDPSQGTGYFIGNAMYLLDDGADSDDGYGGYGGYGGGSSSVFSAAGPVSSFGGSGDRSAQDYIGWGHWKQASENGDASNSGVHFIVGRPTAPNDMPMTGVGQYASIGGTAPTATHNGAPIMGRLAGASLSVDFLIGEGRATVNTVFLESGTPVNVDITNLPISFNRGDARFGGTDFCGTNVRGFFVGSQATRAGMTYQAPGHSGVNGVSGSVGLQRSGSLTPSPVDD